VPHQVVGAERRDAALHPPGFGPALEPGLAATKTHCLTCHKVNGYGGEKVGGNLALIARALTAPDFVKWTLEPSSVNPDTTTPALATNLPQAERRATRESIYDYLSHVPVLPGR